jgi:hypothetical protein
MATRSSSSRSEAALGFRAHSGWAALVAVAGPEREPVAVLRRRVVLSEKTPRQPFHATEGRPFASAEDLILRSTDEAKALAEGALRQAVVDLRAMGHEAVASGLLLAAGRPLPALRDILSSHALIQAAEGQLFRDVLRQASRRCGLRLTEIAERELEEKAARSLRSPKDALQRRVAEWGRALGSPWTRDEKRGRSRGVAGPGGVIRPTRSAAPSSGRRARPEWPGRGRRRRPS